MKLFTVKTYFVMTVISGMLFLSFDAFAIKHVIQVADFQFSPNSLTGIMVGDTIRWEWQNGDHTTTSTSVPSGAEPWNAPLNTTNTNFEYRVLVPGDYTYKCTPHESMNMTGSFQAIATPTGVSHVALPSPKVNFFPNPVGDNVKLFFTSKENEPGMLKVYNVAGEVIMQMPFSIREGENLFDLPVGILSKGMYVFEVSANNRRVGMQTLNKQ